MRLRLILGSVTSCVNDDFAHKKYDGVNAHKVNNFLFRGRGDTEGNIREHAGTSREPLRRNVMKKGRLEFDVKLR